jgi:hypothetical protein
MSLNIYTKFRPYLTIYSIGSNRYSLENNCSILIDISGEEDISIISRCMFLRPIIFNYKDDFYDVYHA